MPKRIPPPRPTCPPRKIAEDGNKPGNLILLVLPPVEREQFSHSLESARFKLHQVLYDVGEPIKSLYFLNDGLASVLTAQTDGKTVEVGLIGSEGFFGLPVAVGFKTSSLRLVIQGDATGYRLPVSYLERIFAQCPSLERKLQRFAKILAMQSTQIAACNRLHDVEERLARWLLMSHDRIRNDTILPV